MLNKNQFSKQLFETTQLVKHCMENENGNLSGRKEGFSSHTIKTNTHTCTLPGIQHKFDKLNMTLIY